MTDAEGFKMKRGHADRIIALLPALCFIVSGVLSVILRQDCNWDLKNYHFYNAYAFLHNRLSFDVAPAQIQSYLNPLLDVPLFLLIANVPPVMAGFAIGGIQGLNVWLIYRMTYETLADVPDGLRHLSGLGAGIVGYLGAANLSEVGTTFGDSISSLFVLGALLIITSSIEPGKTGGVIFRRKSLIASGLLLGIGTGLKQVLAVYSLAVLCAVLLVSSPWRTRFKSLFFSGLAVGIGIIASGGYWMAVLYHYFRNPLFPFYNKIFKSPFYAANNPYVTAFVPRTIYGKLFSPFHFMKTNLLVSEMPFRDSRLALCYVLIVAFAAVFFYRKMRKGESGEDSGRGKNVFVYEKKCIFLIFFAVFSYVIWQQIFSIYRYIIPLEFISALIIVLVAKYVFSNRKQFIGALLVLFALVIVTERPMGWGRVPWTDDFFDVHVPVYKDLDHAMVIMAGYDPVSYVIPYFPETTRFVRVQSNFTGPASRTLLQTEIREILQQENIPKYFLYKEKDHKNDMDLDDVLSHYRLRFDKGQCRKIQSKLDDDLYLCTVHTLRNASDKDTHSLL